jgi:hypothetical protein
LAKIFLIVLTQQLVQAAAAAWTSDSVPTLTRVARFFLVQKYQNVVQFTKTVVIFTYQMAIKYYKWPKEYPNIF